MKAGDIVLCRCPREPYPGRPTEELRVTLSEVNGREFLDIRVWERNIDGLMVRTDRSSVRVTEGEDVASAVNRGCAEIRRRRRGTVTSKIQAQPDRMTPPWENLPCNA